MSEADVDHWLWRLDASGWLNAAQHELEVGEQQVGARKTALVHARRAGGMALNAVLTALGTHQPGAFDRATLESMWGRSYVEHLRHFADHGVQLPEFPEDVALHARGVLGSVLAPGNVVSLQRHAHAEVEHALSHARRIVEACASFVETLRATPP